MLYYRRLLFLGGLALKRVLYDKKGAEGAPVKKVLHVKYFKKVSTLVHQVPPFRFSRVQQVHQKKKVF